MKRQATGHVNGSRNDEGHSSSDYVQVLNFYVDGGCRLNGSPNTYAAAAAVMNPAHAMPDYRSIKLPFQSCLGSQSTVTSSRAEIEAYSCIELGL